LFEFGVLVLKN